MVSVYLKCYSGTSVDLAGERLNISILTDPPLNGLICVGQNITLTCDVTNVHHVQQYLWLIDGEDGGQNAAKLSRTYTLTIHSLSTVNVTCKVYAQVNGNIGYGSNNVIIQPNGEVSIVFSYKHFVCVCGKGGGEISP